MLDLDYAEDSSAETDANFVMTGSGGLVEVQGTAEGKPFTEEEFAAPAAARAPGHRPARRAAEARRDLSGIKRWRHRMARQLTGTVVIATHNRGQAARDAWNCSRRTG